MNKSEEAYNDVCSMIRRYGYYNKVNVGCKDDTVYIKVNGKSRYNRIKKYAQDMEEEYPGVHFTIELGE